MLRLFCIILLCNVRTLTLAEFYTAVDDMEPLIQTYREVTTWLDKYIELENRRLDLMQKLLERYKVEESRATKEGYSYLEIPINVYTLIKRLTKDLELIEKKAKTKYRHRLKQPLQYPSSEDLRGAAKAIARLELIYKLNTTDLANGVITGSFSHYNKPYVEKVTPMKSSDCFELGRALYSENHWGNGKPWMEEALRKYREEKECHYFTEEEVVEDIQFAESQVVEQKFIDQESKTLSMKQLGNNCSRRSGDYNSTHRCNNTRNEENMFEPVLLNSAKRYSALCRGEYDISGIVSKKLFCRYLRSHPFLLLAPVKMEQLYIRPDIFLYHDVISESEIDHLKKLAKKKGLERAKIYDENKVVPSTDRISKDAWFPDSASDVIRRLSRHIGDVTGLDVKSAGQLSVVNYGIGGYYAPHFDYFRKPFVPSYGNRIATVLFYLSDVPQGGATVFMELGLTVFPVRGAALSWYNLHPSGEGDLATYHAACPVLCGSKWVATKWLFTLGQELRNPCSVQAENPLLKTSKPKRF